MEKAWVVRIREQCQAAKVPFFFKQWGGFRKAAAGRQLDDRTYDEMPGRQPAGVVPQQRVRLALIGEVQAWEKDLPLV